MRGEGGWARTALVGILVGTFAGGLVVFLVEAAGHAMFGTGEPADVESVTQTMFAAVLIAWILGSAVGGAVATWWTRARPVWPGVVVGLILLAAAVANMLAFPHPVWLQAAAVVSMPLAAFVAARALSNGPGPGPRAATA